MVHERNKLFKINLKTIYTNNITMGFFKNLIKAREEWLSKPYFRNQPQPQPQNLDTNTNTNAK
jgi:hypothetical protein